jgi:hypothetical protein
MCQSDWLDNGKGPVYYPRNDSRQKAVMSLFLSNPCARCNHKSVLELTSKELGDLDKGLPVEEALAHRDKNYQQIVATGTHTVCWDEAHPRNNQPDNQGV